MTDLTAEFGSDQSTWLSPSGSSHRFSNVNFLGVPQAGSDEVLELEASMNRGTQNHMVTFSDNDTAMCSVTPPGQSGFIAPDGTKSPHYQDQLDLYRDFECKPERMSEAEVNADLQSEVTLEYTLPEESAAL